MKVLIVEDEAPAYRRLEKVLLEIDAGIEIVEVFDSVEETVKWFKNHESPDLAFLDIQISDGISFQIFEKCEVKCPVVFTTAFDEYTLRAFKVNSIDYLLKPVKKEDLQRALTKFGSMYKARNQLDTQEITALLKQINPHEPEYKSRFLVKQGDKMLAVQSVDIVCFYSKHGVVHICTRMGKTYLLNLALDEVMGQVNPHSFFRANRQFIIHETYIEEVHRYFKGKLLVQLAHFVGEEIVVSSEKASSFKQWLDG